MLLQMIRSVTAAGILLAAAGVSGADETQQEYFILSRPVPATATGTVDYAKVTTLSFEAKGRLSFVETPGTLARGNILDLAGNLAVPGDLLAEQDTELPESDVKIAEARLRQAEALLREKQSNYQRDQELLRKMPSAAASMMRRWRFMNPRSLIATSRNSNWNVPGKSWNTVGSGRPTGRWCSRVTSPKAHPSTSETPS